MGANRVIVCQGGLRFSLAIWAEKTVVCGDNGGITANVVRWWNCDFVFHGVDGLSVVKGWILFLPSVAVVDPAWRSGIIPGNERMRIADWIIDKRHPGWAFDMLKLVINVAGEVDSFHCDFNQYRLPAILSTVSLNYL